MSPAKSRGLQERLLARIESERGIDDDHNHHVVLFMLRLLDDDDNYELFCAMEREDEEFGLSPSPEKWFATLKRLATPTEVSVVRPLSGVSKKPGRRRKGA